MTLWEHHPLDHADKFPARPACYVVLSAGMPVYVGQTVNLRSRIRNHNFRATHARRDHAVTPWGNLKDVSFKINFGYRFGDWTMREARLIRRLKPRFNKQGRF